jgi:heme-degrading monooxygenase HmoA
MFVILWQFDIAEEKIPAFEAAYGADGTWSALFARSEEYLGTELLKDAYVPGRYVTLDRWRSEEAFRNFRAQHDLDYEALDRACDSLTGAETRIGAFVAGPDIL